MLQAQIARFSTISANGSLQNDVVPELLGSVKDLAEERNGRAEDNPGAGNYTVSNSSSKDHDLGEYEEAILLRWTDMPRHREPKKSE